MKESETSLKRLALIALLTGFVGRFGEKAAEWLLEHTRLVPEHVIHWALGFLPSQRALLTISHALYWICIPMIVIPFSYTLVREWRYVDRMYVKRDALEAGKITPAQLTIEEFHFIHSHWPELFK